MDPSLKFKSQDGRIMDKDQANKMCIVQRFEADMLRHVHSLREIEPKGESDIQRMYQDAVVFVTGSTGFLGKQLVEKLLRACPGIKKIYLLSRSKKGKDFHQRLEKMLEEPVFDELRRRCPDFKERIVPIEGDVSILRLGIKDQDWELLCEEVTFIFHVAATTRFDEPIKQAIYTNVRGTREVITLARDCKNLRCLVYVSTAYSHCNRTHIEEKFYKSPVDPNMMIDMVDSLDEERLEAITVGLIKDWPNTYTFSKALGEEVVRTMCQGMPVCIIRPAVVVCAYQEPSPGWLDMSNVHYGPSGNFLATGMGIMRVSWVNKESQMHFVSVDYVNNLAIAASWDTVARHSTGERDIKIYTLSRHRNPETWKEFQQRVNIVRKKMMSPRTQFWYAHNFGVRNIYVFWICVFFLHWIPSIIIDPLLALFGSKMRIADFHAKGHKMAILTGAFVFSSWTYHDANTLQLYKKISATDRTIFKFDMHEVDPQSLVNAWCVGVRRFIVKDGLMGTERGERIQWWLHKLHIATMILYAWVVLKVFLEVLHVLDICFDDFLSYFPERCGKKTAF